MENKLNRVIEIDKPRRILLSIGNLLGWDLETQLPEKGSDFRSEQVALLSSLAHEKLTGKPLEEALEPFIEFETEAIKVSSLSEKEKASLKLWVKDIKRARKLPQEFVEQTAKTTSRAFTGWAEAKTKNDFSIYAPHLKSIVDNCRKKAEYYGYTDHPYDALVDEFEPEMTKAKLSEIFDNLKPFLKDKIQAIRSEEPDAPFVNKEYSKEKQLAFAHSLLEKMGIDFTTARLDQAEHPFCLTVHTTDLRMTTHSDLSHFFNNISAVMHEGGHGLYEQGLPHDEFGTPLCDSISLGIHESQSRFWECVIGLSKPFSTFLHKELTTIFPKELSGTSQEEMYAQLTKVNPGFIRIFSDEVCYCLHVILRFEIEVALLEGKMEVEEIPGIWNQKMEEYLGITPTSDAVGCLQDVHWSHGIMGYFPTYALGNIYAGQLFQTFRQENPSWETDVASGKLVFIRDWLKEKIHKYGRQYSPQEMIEKATGKPISSDDYINYLNEKYPQKR